MSDIISPLLQWLNAHPQLAGLVTFTISAGESVAIIGTLVPGTIMMTALGTLAGAGIIPLWETLCWAILGAIVGDGISYWIGRYFNERLPQVWPFRQYPALLESGKHFFHKYGGMSVFIGRFVGPVRALVPLVAGMLGMKPLSFFIANVTSAIGWAPTYMLPGILLGAASLELPPDIAMHVMIVLLLITLFIMLCLWFIYILFKLIHNQINQFLDWVWNKLKSSPYLSPITILLKDHHADQSHGQLSLAVFFIFTMTLLYLLANYMAYTAPDSLVVNEALFHLFRGIRTPSTDDIMINITLLGQRQVIIPAAVALLAWLAYLKRWRTALHALALIGLGTVSIYMMKHLIREPRPWGIASHAESFSMPSGHATLTIIFYLGVAFLAVRSFSSYKRQITYTFTFLLILLVAVSRLYLGAHWFTDILGGWLLGASLLTLVIISYRRQQEAIIPPTGILVVSFSTLCLSFFLYHHFNAGILRANYAELEWPRAEVAMNQWWRNNDMLPAYRVSLFGFPSQQLNIEWVGNLDNIRDTLIKEGWKKPPARDLISTLHRIADISSTEYLPLISPQYLDDKPALILTRHTSNGKGLLVIRLWDSRRIIKGTSFTLWVGTINSVPRSYSWIFKKNNLPVIDPAIVFPSKIGFREWEWSINVMNQPSNTKIMQKQKILLIRQNKSIHKKK